MKFSVSLLIVFLCEVCFAKINIDDPLFKPGALYDYLIITPGQPGIIAECRRFADFKSSCGLRCAICRIDSISSNCTGKDIQEKIKSCLKTAFSEWGITWVLIVGDFNLVPARTVCPGDYNTVIVNDTLKMMSDAYYACVESSWDENGDGIYGNESPDAKYKVVCRFDNAGEYVCDRSALAVPGIDLSYDIYIGRLPVSNVDEARIVFDKVITYTTDYRQTQAASDVLLFGYINARPFVTPDSIDFCNRFSS